MIEAGKTYSFKVLRRTDIGYMLKYDDEEIFLHQNETTRELESDEVIDAFVYYDNKRRIAATMCKPLVSLGDRMWLTVTGCNDALGAFLDIGINKDILVSKDNLPYDKGLWPHEGDKIYAELKSKKDQLFAKPINKFDLKANPNKLAFGDSVKARCMRIFPEGINLYTEDLNVIFVHKTQFRKPVHFGEEVLVNIISVTDFEYKGTLNPNKENLIDNDSLIILEYLKSHFGKMVFGNDSSPEEIDMVFKMSKKAFKRALGHLYKERMIDFVDDETILK